MRERTLGLHKAWGFPAVNTRAYAQEEVYTIVRDIYNSTIFSDIVKTESDKEGRSAERIVKYTLIMWEICFLQKGYQTISNQNTDPWIMRPYI